MNCPVCGASNAPDVKFCAGCGNPMPQQSAAPVNPTPYGAPGQQVPPTGYGAPAAPVAPKAPKEKTKVDFVKVKDQLVETVKPVGAKAKDVWSNKKARIGIIGGAVALIALVVVFIIFFGGNGYIQAEESIKLLQTGNNEYAVVVGTKVLDDTVSAYTSTSTTMNGKVMTFISDGDLYAVKDSKLVNIADDVTDYSLSVNGEYVAYTTDSDSLYLAKTSNGESEKICDDMEEYADFAISPDGKSVAYFDGDDLRLYRDKDSTKITDSENAALYGLSNSGNQIYVSIYKDGESILYSFNNKGEKTKLGEKESVEGFNESHSQIIFHNDGKTYISKDGKEASKVSSNYLYLVETNYSTSFGYTYPVSNLYDHVYHNGEGDVYLVKENDCIKLVSKATSLQLDSSAKYLYYIYDYEELRVIEIAKGEKASESAKTIVNENIGSYFVTSDRKYVYYVDDLSLKSVNGQNGGKSTRIASLYEGWTFSNKDRLYYIMDGDLYVCSNGKDGKKILSDVDSLTRTLHGDVYARADDAWYGSDGDEKLKELVEID